MVATVNPALVATAKVVRRKNAKLVIRVSFGNKAPKEIDLYLIDGNWTEHNSDGSFIWPFPENIGLVGPQPKAEEPAPVAEVVKVVKAAEQHDTAMAAAFAAAATEAPADQQQAA